MSPASPAFPVSWPVPTRFGWVYLGFVLVTLLGCINYQLSIGYFLCFLMLSVWLVCFVEARSALVGVRVHSSAADPVFAGQQALLTVTITNVLSRPRENLQVQVGDHVQVKHLDPQAEAQVQVLLDTRQRGWMPAPDVGLQGGDPFGLFRVQVQVRGAPQAVLVYPALEAAPPPWPHTGEATGMRVRKSGHDEYQGLRPYQAGDSLSRVAWKRGELPDGSLLTKAFETHVDSAVHLSYLDLPAALNPEQRLSRLAAWVVQGQRLGVHFRLTLPGFDAAGSGERHAQHCLTTLAEFQEKP